MFAEYYRYCLLLFEREYQTFPENDILSGVAPVYRVHGVLSSLHSADLLCHGSHRFFLLGISSQEER